MEHLNKAILLNQLNEYEMTALEMLDQALGFFSIVINNLREEDRISFMKDLEEQCKNVNLPFFDFANNCNRDMAHYQQGHSECCKNN